MQFFPIGELSRLSNVKVPTIRYYESVGLLPEPERASNNRRVYTQASLRRLNFIRRARELGFDFDAIRQLQSLMEHPEQPCSNVHAIAEHRLHDIKERIHHLTDLKTRIEAMVHHGCHESIKDCAILGSLDIDEDVKRP